MSLALMTLSRGVWQTGNALHWGINWGNAFPLYSHWERTTT